MKEHINIKTLVLEIRHKKRSFKELENIALGDKDQLEELFQLVFNEVPYPMEEYASWLLTHIFKAHPEIIQPYAHRIIDHLFRTRNQSVLRNLTNIIYQLELDDYRESEFVDLLISFIQDPKNKVALHVYSIYTLINYILKYPELKQEIAAIIELSNKGKTAAFAIARRNFYRQTIHLEKN